jgi:hypothetical protein
MFTRFPKQFHRSLSARLGFALGAAAIALQVASSDARAAEIDPPAVCVAPAPAVPAEDSAASKATSEKRFESEAFVRTELFFGSERPDLPEVSPEEFQQFLDQAVTPCFPDGLTLLTGKGQFRESDDRIVQETSFVLVLLYPLATRKESNAKIEALRDLYEELFLQESVLRVDDPRAARVGF